MPNIVGNVVNPENPEWISLRFDDGSQSPWAHDPTGDFRRESDEIARKIAGVPPNPMAGAVAGPGGAGLDAAGNPILDLDEPEPAPVAPAPVVAPVAPPPEAPTAPVTAPAQPDGADLAGNRARLGAAARQGGKPLDYNAAPGPMGLGGASVVTRGIAEPDRAIIQEKTDKAIQSKREAETQSVDDETARLKNEWDSLSTQAKAKLAEADQGLQQERTLNMRIADNRADLQGIMSRKVDGAGALKGETKWYALLAGLGDALANFGAALAGQRPVADPGKTINGIIDRYVQEQTAQKQADFEMGKITADQLTADREYTRLKIQTALKQHLDTMGRLEKNVAAQSAIKAGYKHIAAEADKSELEAAKAAATETQRQENYAPLVPKKIEPTNETLEELKRMGITPDDYSKGMQSKLANEKGQTVNEAIVAIHEMDQDLEMLKAIKAENGVIPTRNFVNMPAWMRSKLAQMGVSSGMKAEEANQLITGYIIKKAKSYGGVITESDRESAELEFGKSGEGLMSGIQRMRASADGLIKQNLATTFRGNGQQVLNIALRDAGRMTGVPRPSDIEDFDVHTATPPAEGPHELSDVEQRQKANRDELGRKAKRIWGTYGDRLTAPPSTQRGKF